MVLNWRIPRMITHSKKIGVIEEFEGYVSQVGMYHMANEPEFIWYGEELIILNQQLLPVQI